MSCLIFAQFIFQPLLSNDQLSLVSVAWNRIDAQVIVEEILLLEDWNWSLS